MIGSKKGSFCLSVIRRAALIKALPTETVENIEEGKSALCLHIMFW
jgi:hypothetical protein